MSVSTDPKLRSSVVTSDQGSSDANGSNAMTKISAGPAAMAALLIYQIMALYAEVTKISQEQKKNMTLAQAAESQGQADSTRASGQAACKWAMIAAGATIGGAVLAIGTTVGMSKIGEGAAANEEFEAANKELTPMKSIDKNLSTDRAIQQVGNNPNSAAAERMSEFKRGDFSKAKDDAETKDAIKHMKANEEEFNNWKNEFKENLRLKSQDYNSATSRVQASMTHISNVKGLVDSFANAGSSVAQGLGQAAKSNNDANSALQGGASQMAGSAAGDSGQSASKAFDAQNGEMEVLKGMVRASAPN